MWHIQTRRRILVLLPVTSEFADNAFNHKYGTVSTAYDSLLLSLRIFDAMPKSLITHFLSAYINYDGLLGLLDLQPPYDHNHLDLQRDFC